MKSFKNFFKLAWVQYTDKVLGGDSLFFRVRINPKYKEDKGLHAHEFEHVRHWYIVTIMALITSVIVTYMTTPSLLLAPMAWVFFVGYSGLIYNFLTTVSKACRLKAESKCFAVQLAQYPKENFENYLSQLSVYLSEGYSLDITVAQARISILKEYQRNLAI